MREANLAAWRATSERLHNSLAATRSIAIASVFGHLNATTRVSRLSFATAATFVRNLKNLFYNIGDVHNFVLVT
jgi:hypothetical protein